MRKQKQNIDFDSEIERYLQNRCVINDKELTFKEFRKIQLCFLYFVLIRIIRDVFSIFDSDTEIEKLFNQKRDIIHYRRNRFHVSTIEILMMLRIHIEKKNIL